MGTKATLTYHCEEDGEEQTMTVTAENTPDGMTHVKMEFDPECSDDTSDPFGLITAAIQAFKVVAGQRRRQVDVEDDSET